MRLRRGSATAGHSLAASEHGPDVAVGIESYAALALGTWLRQRTDGQARAFARSSALAAMVLEMLGQVSYHLLAASHARRAPDLVVVLVACLPVVVLGCAVALLHLLSATEQAKVIRRGRWRTRLPNWQRA